MHSPYGLKSTPVLKAITKADWDLRNILRAGGAGTLRTDDQLIQSLISNEDRKETKPGTGFPTHSTLPK